MRNRPDTIILPASVNTPDSVSYIEVGNSSSIVIIGANGTGKTRLGTFLEAYSGSTIFNHRISAQKSLTFPLSSSVTSRDEAAQRFRFGDAQQIITIEQIEANPVSIFSEDKGRTRWKNNPNTGLLDDYSLLMNLLFTESAHEVFELNEKRKADPSLPAIDTKLDRTKTIWERLLPHRELVVSMGKVETRVPGGTTYNATEMSDGERVIFYLIGEALAAPSGGLFIIDEPEIHVHKSLQSQLWDAIETARPDCLFVYLTHDLDFAASRTAAKKFWLKGFDGDHTWDWVELSSQDVLPEPLRLSLLGSRKPILFIEGRPSSLDIDVYKHVYSDFTIVPSDGCEPAIRNTRAFASMNAEHHLECRGLIDRDSRTPAGIVGLETSGIFVTPGSEVENLLLEEDALRVVARSLSIDEPTITAKISEIKDAVIGKLASESEHVISKIAAVYIENSFLGFDAKAKGKVALKATFDTVVASVDTEGIYDSIEAEVSKIISDRDYTSAIRIYANKGLTGFAAAKFGLRNSEAYIEYCKRLLKSNDPALRDTLRSILPAVTV